MLHKDRWTTGLGCETFTILFCEAIRSVDMKNLVCAKLRVFPIFGLGNHRAVKIIRTDISERVNNNYL